VVAPGDKLGGKYRLDSLLGEGGMGSVFAAENVNTGRRVAVKVLHGEWMLRPEVRERFTHEARATTAISHPNIVEVLDLDTDATLGVAFIVQELLQGKTLEDYLVEQPDERLEVADALAIIVPVMEALISAHARGIVHRDLKPANVFLTTSHSGERVPKVIDFGIAKDVSAAAGGARHTQQGVAIGTPDFMSPEQVEGVTDLDAGTDVWALGVLLYVMLSGRLPYEAPSVNLVMGKILYEPPTPLATHRPDLPPPLLAVVEGALRRDRSARTASVRAMLDAVLACEGAPRPVAAPTGSWAPPLTASSLPPPSPTGVGSPPVSAPPAEPAAPPTPRHRHTMSAIERGAPVSIPPPRRRGLGVMVFGGITAVVVAIGVTLATRSSVRPVAVTAARATSAPRPVTAPPTPVALGSAAAPAPPSGALAPPSAPPAPAAPAPAPSSAPPAPAAEPAAEVHAAPAARGRHPAPARRHRPRGPRAPLLNANEI
jgi:serine/threonine protein kinase